MEQRIFSVKLIIGLFFTALGILLAADNLDLIVADLYLRYWPVVLILIGAVKLADRGGRVVGAILAVVGASLLVDNLHWVRFTVFDLWPLLLIGGGLAMVARALGARVQLGGSGDNIVAILSNRKIARTERDFSGANIVAFLGGCELDLTGADIAQSPAVIEAVAVWGGVQIFVPDRWEVIGEVTPFMGGFEVTTAPTGKPERQLIVRGAAVMGGIEVKRRAA